MNQPVNSVNLGIEQMFLGGSLDFGPRTTASAFKVSPELEELQERYLQSKGEKQNMTIATSCFAMACPIMPLGFLAALFVLGRLDGMDKDPVSMEYARTLKGDMARIAAAEALMRKRKDSGEDPESNAYLRYASREMQLRPLRMAMRPIKGSEKRVIPKQQQSRDSLNGGYFLTKEKMLKERENKRQKILLESLQDKEDCQKKSQPMSSDARKLTDKLEKLDQLLKRISETD